MNTSRAIEFVSNVLVHVHSDMNVILKDPGVIRDLNAELAAIKASLVRRYEFDAVHRNVKVYLSSYELRNQFGKPAEAIWRKLFVRLNKGGWSPVTREAYDSCWVLNLDAERRFLFAKQRYAGADGITPAQVLLALNDIDEQVVAPTEYAAEDDDDLGFKHVQGYSKRVMTRDRHRDVLRESQQLRADVKVHNRRLHRAMFEQQTFYPVMSPPEPAQG